MSGTTTLAPTTPTNRRLAGITSFTVDGSNIPVVEFIWDPSPIARETMSSLSGVDGYSEKYRAPFISGKLRDSQAISISAFNALTSSTVVVQLANGKQIVGHGMWFVGELNVSGAEATFEVRFEGQPGAVQELGAAT
jgi:hypothetical protein